MSESKRAAHPCHFFRDITQRSYGVTWRVHVRCKRPRMKGSNYCWQHQPIRPDDLPQKGKWTYKVRVPKEILEDS